MKKLLGIFLFFSLISRTYALDLEDQAQDFQKIKDWTAFSISDDSMGLVLATRAGTEDKRKDATLALTYPTNANCKLMPIDIIIKLNGIIEEPNIQHIYGNIQVDDNPVKNVLAKLENNANDQFVFITVPPDGLEGEIKNGRNFMANFRGFGVIDFSLNGANIAITEAKNNCLQHKR